MSQPDDDCPCPPRPRTKCDRYVPGSKNRWVEKGPFPGDEARPGICMLDTMTPEQVIYVIERNEGARKDLLTVTSDPDLLELAQTVPPLSPVEQTDRDQKINGTAASPYYAFFRGQPPTAR